MGYCTIQLDGKLMEWTSISDSPITPLLTEEQFFRYWKEQYGRSRWYDYYEILDRVKERGTSSYANSTVDEVIKNNHAGKNGKCLTKEQLIEAYTVTAAEFEQWCKDKDKWEMESALKFRAERNKRK